MQVECGEGQAVDRLFPPCRLPEDEELERSAHPGRERFDDVEDVTCAPGHRVTKANALLNHEEAVRRMSRQDARSQGSPRVRVPGRGPARSPAAGFTEAVGERPTQFLGRNQGDAKFAPSDRKIGSGKHGS